MIDGIIDPSKFGPRGSAHFQAAGGGDRNKGVQAYQKAAPAVERTGDRALNTVREADAYDISRQPVGHKEVFTPTPTTLTPEQQYQAACKTFPKKP